MPIDHTSLPVRDLDASLKFYLAILKPLNYSLFMHLEKENVVGLQAKYHGPDFWLTKAAKGKENNTIIHIAFKGRSRKDVHAFHEAALLVTSSIFPILIPILRKPNAFPPRIPSLHLTPPTNPLTQQQESRSNLQRTPGRASPIHERLLRSLRPRSGWE
jgi:hypothetical protein